MLRLLALLLGLGALAQPAGAWAAPDPAGLIAASQAQGLADSRGWQVLVHYRKDLLGRGVTSLADSPAFFLAPTGKRDPHAELEATLRAFAAPPGEGEPPARCVYPARFAWLDAQLGFEAAGLPIPACPELDEWLTQLRAASLTLVFAEAFMNNPASSFGHTLLRIDPVPAETVADRRDLLAYAVNFAAESGPDTGALYAVRGIVGSYPGFFSLEPYYEKVNRYGDWESRDLWEYPIGLEPDEIRQLLRHLWELRDVGFDYYFFDENCSYELLGLVEAGRPSLDLRGRFPAWVIPIDTVRAQLEVAGLTGEVRYRPSAETRLRHLIGKLDPAEKQLALEISEGTRDLDDPEVAHLTDERRTLVLTAAYDHLRFEGDPKQDPTLRSRSRRILLARSRVPVTGEPGPALATPEIRPDQGHGSARLSLGSGVRDGDFFLEARVRPALHDLLDPQGGYAEGAQIDFMELALRFVPEDSDLELHELDLVDIVSLSPRDRFFQPISWKFRTGIQNRLLPRRGSRSSLGDALVFRSEGGAGVALQPFEGALAFVLLDSTLEVASRLENDFALGVGTSAGLIFGDDRDRWRARVRAGVTRFVAGDARTAFSAGVDQRLRLTRNTGIELRVGVEHDFRDTWLDAGLFWKLWY